MSFTPYSSNRILTGAAIDHSALWVQVHTGDPGADGTVDVSTASPTRVLGAFDEVDNLLSNTAQIDLASDGTGVNTLRWVSLWDAVSGGNCIYTRGAISPQITFTAGEDVAIEIGALTVELIVQVD